MFQVDTAGNSLEPLQHRSFAELGVGERAHLQEWIESRPEALGEDLLVLCKEFGGLSGTRSRIDLLALDKSGRLVIIETKLDSPGPDVAWQATRYAAHAAVMDKQSIVAAHQRYLDRARIGARAEDRITSFLGSRTSEASQLNPAGSQRIVLVAGAFPKEVGATVLWLRGQGVAIQCITATLMSRGGDLFLDLKQIVPGPGESVFQPMPTPRHVVLRNRRPVSEATSRHRMEFWSQLLALMQDAEVEFFSKAKASSESWLSTSAGRPYIIYRLSIGATYAQVELRFDHESRVENQKIFDYFQQNRESLETAFGERLNWRSPKNWPMRTISFSREFRTGERTSWPAASLWLVEYAWKLHRAAAPLLRDG